MRDGIQWGSVQQFDYLHDRSGEKREEGGGRGGGVRGGEGGGTQAPAHRIVAARFRLTYGATYRGNGLSNGGTGMHLTFLDLDFEAVFERHHFSISSGEGVSSGLVEVFGLEGRESVVIEFVGVCDGTLFGLATRLAREISIGVEDTGSGCIHLFGGPGDDVLVDHLVSQHSPGVFA